MNKLNAYLQDRQNTLRWAGWIILIMILLFSLYVDKSHAHSWAEKHVPFFWSIFGIAAAATIIGFARWFAHSGIMVRPDYYEGTGKHDSDQPNSSRSAEHA